MIQDLLPIISFIKSPGGPRSIMVIVILLILSGVLIHQYLGARKPEKAHDTDSSDKGGSSEGSHYKDTLVAGIALIAAICFLFIATLLFYLMFID